MAKVQYEDHKDYLLKRTTAHSQLNQAIKVGSYHFGVLVLVHWSWDKNCGGKPGGPSGS